MTGIFIQEKEMEKQKLLYQQARLHDRGAAEMVLQTISASKGKVLVYRLNFKSFIYIKTFKVILFFIGLNIQMFGSNVCFQNELKSSKFLTANLEKYDK